MPVDSRHPDHEAHLNKWARCRAAVAGGDAVKAENTLYLPKLGGQTAAEYNAYRDRALFFGATGRTVQGLQGAIFRHDPDVDVPPAHDNFLEVFTADGLDLTEFASRLTAEVLTTGRAGLLVDAPLTGEGAPYASIYAAEKIINWRVHLVGSKLITSRVVLEENASGADPDDPWIERKIEQWRVLFLDEVGLYTQQLFRRDTNNANDFVAFGDPILPTRAGQRLDFIPFVFLNAVDLSHRISKPPLLDLVDVNLSHYRTSADLEHGAHFTALPTAWVAGFPMDSEFRIGSSTAWITTEVNAKAGFLEYTGQGLGALSSLKADKEQLMAVLGARLLESQKKAVEAADTHQIRQAGEHNALAVVGRTVSAAVERGLRHAVWWSGATDAQVDGTTFKLNDDFIAAHMDAQETTALMKTWQSGGMSLDSFLWNMKRGELLPPDRTIDDEKDLIDVESSTGDKGDGNITPIGGRKFGVERDSQGQVVGLTEESSP